MCQGVPKMCPQRKQARAKNSPDLPYSGVELPGIEPATKITLTCGNLGLTTRNDAKVREKTWESAEGVDGINKWSDRLATHRLGSWPVR